MVTALVIIVLIVIQWLNVPDDQITKCALDALRLKEDGPNAVHESLIPTFFDKALPKGAEPIGNFLDNPPEELLPVLEYLMGRNLYLEDYPFYWTPEDGFNNRFIIPFYYKGNTVGYTARKITEGKPKYISEQQPNYVFNLDNQPWNKKFVIVCEGPMDAICVGGVAVMSSEVGAGQRLLINQLNKEVIVVPDRDHDGPKKMKTIWYYMTWPWAKWKEKQRIKKRIEELRKQDPFIYK